MVIIVGMHKYSKPTLHLGLLIIHDIAIFYQKYHLLLPSMSDSTDGSAIRISEHIFFISYYGIICFDRVGSRYGFC